MMTCNLNKRINNSKHEVSSIAASGSLIDNNKREELTLYVNDSCRCSRLVQDAILVQNIIAGQGGKGESKVTNANFSHASTNYTHYCGYYTH